MRVLIAVHHYPPRRVGGAELLARRQARWLAQQGIETRVVCVETLAFGSPRVTWDDEELDEIPVRRLHLQYPDPMSLLRAAFQEETLTQHFREIISAWQPDLVHLISGYLLGTAPLNAARALHIPTVVTLTDFWFLCPTIQLLKGDGTLCQGPEPLECARCLYDRRRIFRAVDERAPRVMKAFWRAAERHVWLGKPFDLPPLLDALKTRRVELMRALNETDAILAVTNFLAEMYEKNGLDSGNLIVKPNGLELETFDPFTPRAPSDEIVFGYMGQIAPIKGVAILLRAFRIAQNANPTKKLRLMIFGRVNAEASYAEKLEKLARGNPAIIFVGAYEHARALALLAGMDALVVPSTWHENAPIVIQEAFAARTPVIGSDVGGIAEWVKHGTNGLLFARGEANDLARTMQRIIDEPNLIEQLRRNFPTTRTYHQDMQELMGAYQRVLAKTKVMA